MKNSVFYTLLLICGLVSCIDMYYTFRNHNCMMEEERNCLQLIIMQKSGIEFAMFCRMLNTIIAIIALQAVYHTPKKRMAWILLTVWSAQQIWLITYFVSAEPYEPTKRIVSRW